MTTLESAFALEMAKIAFLKTGKKKSFSKKHFPTFRKALKGAKWGGLGLGALLAYNALKGAGEARRELQQERRGY